MCGQPKGRSHFEWSEQLGLFRQPGRELKLQHTVVWARPPQHFSRLSVLLSSGCRSV